MKGLKIVTKSNKTIWLCTFILALASFKKEVKTIVRADLKKYFEQYKVTGSFALYDEQKDTYILTDPAEFKKAYSPASTFKICNSLIGLETGVINNEDFIIKWDSVVRDNVKWNKDHDLKTAYKNSTVWYYRELARRVGGKQMKYWLDKAQFGNADTSGGIDLFWLRGGLRITPQQQLDFLKRLHDNKLPFSKRSTDIVKKIMIAKDTLGYVVRAKGGWSDGDPNTGWYVGYVETKSNVYYFANCIHTPDFNKAPARIEIVYRILEELKLIQK
ncbi:MAG: class D beta-lactamase [Bacteroidetes bacterium]|nr:class D beta-lactamase [Bacteroidota bacterium]